MSRLIEVNSREEIDQFLKDEQMLLIYLGGNNCSVCVDLKPKIEKLLDKYPLIKGINIDTVKNHNLAVSFTIFAIPSILLYIEGKETLKEVRNLSVSELDGKIDRYYKMIF